jgi:hypothetical protein
MATGLSHAPSPDCAQAVAERAVGAVGCGYDLTSDLWLPRVKPGRIVDFGCDRMVLSDLFLPGGAVVKGVPDVIKSDKGERMRFRSDVVSFHQVCFFFHGIYFVFLFHMTRL